MPESFPSGTLDEKNSPERPGPAAGKDTFLTGMRDCLPLVLGYVTIGLTFGVLARTSGFSVLEVLLMSLLIYAGSSQFIAVGLLAAAAPVSAIIVTVFLVNLRHFLYSAALAPYVRKLRTWQNVLVGAELTDETFAVAIHHLAGRQAANARWLYGLNLTAQASWVLSTTLGAVLGNAISNTETLGLDFALPAMFAALLILQIAHQPRLRVAVTVAVAGAVVAVAGARFVSTSWALILAAVAAATLGVLIEGKK